MDLKSINVRIGANIRVKRVLLGLSQAALGDALGISFQQFQKYEKGENRISAGALLVIARHLHTTVSELIGEDANAFVSTVPSTSATVAPSGREVMTLADAYSRIPSALLRRTIRDLVFAVAKQTASAAEAA